MKKGKTKQGVACALLVAFQGSGFMNMGGQLGGALTASLTPVIAQRFGWTSSGSRDLQ
jgi:hypothetical protein